MATVNGIFVDGNLLVRLREEGTMWIRWATV